MTWHLCPGTITVKTLVWPVDLDESDNSSNVQWIRVQNHEKQIFQSKKFFCTFSSFCCPQYWGEQTRVFNWTSCVWFDITNEAWWDRWTFSWAPSRLQKAPLTATGKHYAKEGKINTVRLGRGRRRWGGGLMGVRGKIALEQPLHVQWEWTFSH